MIDRADLMTKAIGLRKRFGEDSSSPIDIFSLVQNIEQLTLVFYPMGDKLSGMCIKVDEKNCVIALNSGMSMGRQRFSLAHELYHKYFDDTMISVCAKNIGDGKDIERMADIFASFFLMPNDELLRKVTEYTGGCGKLDVFDVVRLEQYFGVSHQAMLMRLKENKLMRNADIDKLMACGVRSIAEMMGYDARLYYPMPEEKKYMTYGNYIGLVNKTYEKELISTGKYEELLLDAFRQDMVYGETKGGDVID